MLKIISISSRMIPDIRYWCFNLSLNKSPIFFFFFYFFIATNDDDDDDDDALLRP